MKWIVFILTVLLVVTNGYWFYTNIDKAVTESYEDQEKYELENRIKAYAKLNNHFVNGMKKEELGEILNQLFPEFVSYEKEGHLNSL